MNTKRAWEKICCRGRKRGPAVEDQGGNTRPVSSVQLEQCWLTGYLLIQSWYNILLLTLAQPKSGKPIGKYTYLVRTYCIFLLILVFLPLHIPPLLQKYVAQKLGQARLAISCYYIDLSETRPLSFFGKNTQTYFYLEVS